MENLGILPPRLATPSVSCFQMQNIHENFSEDFVPQAAFSMRRTRKFHAIQDQP
jgi:hypothetical protein